MAPRAVRGWFKDAVRATPISSRSKKVTPVKKAAPKKAKAAPKKAKAAPKKATKASPKKRFVNKGDPVDIILAKMAEMDQINIPVVKEEILLRATGYARHDSNGYRVATKKLIKELAYVTRTTKNKETTYALTETGRDYLLANGTIEVPPEARTNEEHHAQLLESLKKFVKGPEQKLETIFNMLRDGESHLISDLLAATGYSRPDSKGYRNIMSGMKTLDLLEKTGKNVRFKDNAFKFGRPNN